MNGTYRLFVFAGNCADTNQMERVFKFGDYIDSAASVVSRFTPRGAPRNSVIEIYTIHSNTREQLDMQDFPAPSLYPPYGYDAIYADAPTYHSGHGLAYDKYGIDKNHGAIVVVRPDGYVGLVCNLEDTKQIDAYFNNALLAPAQPTGHETRADWTFAAKAKAARRNKPINGASKVEVAHMEVAQVAA
jgi:phenol 2-monooxygenase